MLESPIRQKHPIDVEQRVSPAWLEFDISAPTPDAGNDYRPKAWRISPCPCFRKLLRPATAIQALKYHSLCYIRHARTPSLGEVRLGSRTAVRSRVYFTLGAGAYLSIARTHSLRVTRRNFTSVRATLSSALSMMPKHCFLDFALFIRTLINRAMSLPQQRKARAMSLMNHQPSC